jgi:hypothetical protein
MPEYSDYLEGLTLATGLTGAERLGMSQGGDATGLTADMLEPNRGDYAGGTDFPTTGGRYTGGLPKRGDRWRLTGNLIIGGVDVYATGIIIEAATDAPGQTTGNWIKIQTL